MTRLWRGIFFALLFEALLLIPIALLAAGTTYYITSTGGSDAYDGLAAVWDGSHGPWATLNKINAKAGGFAQDDIIYLIRGSAWTDYIKRPSDGAAGHPIIVQAYGTGAPPEIRGYNSFTATGSWMDAGSNNWYASTANSGWVNDDATNNACSFGGLWGSKVAAQVNLAQAQDWWYDSANKRIYVYATANPFTQYGAINYHGMTNGIPIMAHSYWTFRGLKFAGQTGTAAACYQASETNIRFEYCEFDGMRLPQASRQSVKTVAGGVGDVLYNCVIHGWNNNIDAEETGANQPLTIENCIVFGSLNYGIYSGASGAGNYSYSFASSGASIVYPLGTQTVNTNTTDGGNNVARSTLPKFVNSKIYPVKIAFEVDDAGAQAQDDYINTFIAEFDNRGVKLSVPVICSYAIAGGATEQNKIAAWLVNGHELCSHSYSHLAITALNGFTIRYVGAAAACTMTVSGTTLTTSTTGAVDDLSIDLTNASYDTMGELIAYIDGLAAYTCAIHANNNTYSHSKILADVAAQDIKTGSYVALMNKSRLTTDEANSSKAWLNSTFGVSPVSYVLPGGATDSTCQPLVAAEGFTSARGTGQGDYSYRFTQGVNAQNLNGFDMASFHGKTQAQIIGYVNELVGYCGYFGMPCVAYAHTANAITAAEWGYILDAFIAAGASIVTQSQVATWITGGALKPGTTFYYQIAPPTTPNFQLLLTSPLHGIGANLSLALDILGNTVPAWTGKLPDIGCYEMRPTGVTYLPRPRPRPNLWN